MDRGGGRGHRFCRHPAPSARARHARLSARGGGEQCQGVEQHRAPPRRAALRHLRSHAVGNQRSHRHTRRAQRTRNPPSAGPATRDHAEHRVAAVRRQRRVADRELPRLSRAFARRRAARVFHGRGRHVGLGPLHRFPRDCAVVAHAVHPREPTGRQRRRRADRRSRRGDRSGGADGHPARAGAAGGLFAAAVPAQWRRAGMPARDRGLLRAQLARGAAFPVASRALAGRQFSQRCAVRRRARARRLPQLNGISDRRRRHGQRAAHPRAVAAGGVAVPGNRPGQQRGDRAHRRVRVPANSSGGGGRSRRSPKRTCTSKSASPRAPRNCGAARRARGSS